MAKSIERRILNEAKRLIGLQVTAIRYMTPWESRQLSIDHRSVVLTLSDGTEMYPMADDEENDAGVLIARSPDGEEMHLSYLDQPHRPTDGKLFYVQLQYRNAAASEQLDWVDLREGPFESAEEAAEFVRDECGSPWRVVDEDFEDSQIVLLSGSDDLPPADPPMCPACKTRNCEPGGGNWWCIDCGMEF